jgi:hypothetical protein
MKEIPMDPHCWNGNSPKVWPVPMASDFTSPPLFQNLWVITTNCLNYQAKRFKCTDFINLIESTPRCLWKPKMMQRKNKPEIALVTDISGEWRAGVTPQTVWYPTMPARPKVVTIWEKAKLGATRPKPSIPVRPRERAKSVRWRLIISVRSKAHKHVNCYKQSMLQFYIPTSNKHIVLDMWQLRSREDREILCIKPNSLTTPPQLNYKDPIIFMSP